MADCKVTRTKVEYTLTLSEEEAEAIRAVFYVVGGHPNYTRRRLVEAVDGALENAGVDVDASDVQGSWPWRQKWPELERSRPAGIYFSSPKTGKL